MRIGGATRPNVASPLSGHVNQRGHLSAFTSNRTIKRPVTPRFITPWKITFFFRFILKQIIGTALSMFYTFEQVV